MKKGFTLVELLVVIAIIGLLSTIVLVSFGPIRNRARDTAIRANMSTMRLATEVHFDNNGTYVNANTRADYLTANSAATDAGGTVHTANFSATAYCIGYNLPGGGRWCVDSTGFVGNRGCVVANLVCT